MCDYSLMAVPNRLAQEGEELVTHRFPTGSLGLASPADLKYAVSTPPAADNLLDRLKDFFDPTAAARCAQSAFRPGARLRLQGLPPRIRHEFGGPVEER